MEDIKKFLNQMNKPSSKLMAPSLQKYLLDFKFHKNEIGTEKIVANSYLDLPFTNIVKDEEFRKVLLNTYHDFYTEAISIVTSKAEEYLTSIVEEDSFLNLSKETIYEEKIAVLVNTISSILTGSVVLGINTTDYLNEEEPKNDDLGDKFILVNVSLHLTRAEGENEFNLLWGNQLSCWVKSTNGPEPYEVVKHISI